MSEAFASIILDVNVGKALDYAIPTHLQGQIFPGMRVEVPLRGKTQKGTVSHLKETPSFPSCQSILQISSDYLLSENLLSLAKWMSNYYCTPLSKVLKCFVPSPIRKEVQIKKQIFLSLNISKKEALHFCQNQTGAHPAQAKVLEHFLHIKKGVYQHELIKELSISHSPIETLLEKKMLKAQKVLYTLDEFALSCSYFPTSSKKLHDEQKAALEKIIFSISKKVFSPFLLFGITGSGKTEIYLQAIEETIKQKKSCILLLPEVMLTTQIIEIFKARFPEENIAILHHKKSQGERAHAWEEMQKGNIRIVIGARSAIFAPAKNLGLIIVDEEHDSSYKQTEEAPTYHARNVAVMRAKLENAAIVLGSATPSLESFYNAKSGKYTLLTLSKRAQKATLPKVHIIDMKEEYAKTKSFTHFSSKLLEGIQKRYLHGEQTILFLNRRGYHTFVLCTSCSNRFLCPHCDLALTFHKSENLLSCHLCGYTTPPSTVCPVCHSATIKYKGYGTEHVERSLKAIFPEIRTLRVDRDTTAKKESHEELLHHFRSGKADVLIGTQMIAKGLDFPAVTLVGVLHSDAALHIPDFRSTEKVFQLITQVSGRSGRGSLSGEVIIQTFLPQNNTLLLATKQDYPSFYEEEIANRQSFSYPPFSSLAKIIFSGNEENRTLSLAQDFRQKLISQLPKDYNIFPIVPSGRPKMKDQYRFQGLIQGKNIQKLSSMLQEVLSKNPFPSDVSVLIDIDPLSTFF